MTAVPAAALLLVLMTPAHCQPAAKQPVTIDGIKVGRMADTEQIALWKVLASTGINGPDALRARAREQLVRRKELPFEFERLEVTGFASVDDTNKIRPGMVDKQVKTSNLNEVLPTGSRFWDTWNYLSAALGKDVREAASDTQGIPTERSGKIIDQLKGVRVNELFAHSWGTEVVYLGILNGKIIPPKKLIIMGVPEESEEKWLMLAKYTGIEVHVVGFEWDKLRMLGTAATEIKSGLPWDTAGLNKLWAEKCAERTRVRACADPTKFVRTTFDYDIHVRPPDIPKGELTNGHVLSSDHERALYYAYLASRNLFNKTVAELDAPQLELIKAEEQRMLAEYMAVARDEMAAARTRAEIQAFDRSNRFNNDLISRGDEYARKMAELKGDGPAPAAALQQNPAGSVIAARGHPVIFFTQMLPKVKDFAAASCRAPGQVPLTEDITRPFENIYFNQESDDREADRLTAGLDDCELGVFRKLIEVIRLGRGPWITDRWMRDTATSYQAATPPEQRPAPPPPERAPEGRSEPGCEVINGIRACPK